MQSGWESEIGGSRPGTEMFGGNYSSRPRPAWVVVPGWVDGWSYATYCDFDTCGLQTIP
jgi:hypothetical protein